MTRDVSPAAEAEDGQISILTAYMVGLEGVLARLEATAAQAVFLSASDFSAGLVRVVSDAIDVGQLPASQRAANKPIQKQFQDGWPSLTIPATMDLILQRSQLIAWLMRAEEARVFDAHFNKTAVAPQLPHHLDALFDGLGVIERHRGDTRAIRPTRDDRARTQQQTMNFGFGMR